MPPAVHPFPKSGFGACYFACILNQNITEKCSQNAQSLCIFEKKRFKVREMIEVYVITEILTVVLELIRCYLNNALSYHASLILCWQL